MQGLISDKDVMLCKSFVVDTVVKKLSGTSNFIWILLARSSVFLGLGSIVTIAVDTAANSKSRRRNAMTYFSNNQLIVILITVLLTQIILEFKQRRRRRQRKRHLTSVF